MATKTSVPSVCIPSVSSVVKKETYLEIGISL